MAEPYFPAPSKKESAPYRVAAPVPPVTPPLAPRTAKLVTPRVDLVAPPKRPAPAAEEAEVEPFWVRLAWRFAAKAVALAVTLGILWALVRAHELGAKWPDAVLMVLGIVGILAAPVVLYFRFRQLVRMLFARDDDA